MDVGNVTQRSESTLEYAFQMLIKILRDRKERAELLRNNNSPIWKIMQNNFLTAENDNWSDRDVVLQKKATIHHRQNMWAGRKYFFLRKIWTKGTHIYNQSEFFFLHYFFQISNDFDKIHLKMNFIVKIYGCMLVEFLGWQTRVSWYIFPHNKNVGLRVSIIKC